MNKTNPKVLDYLDYRSFLRDYYDFNKKKDNKFSHRFFLKKAGIPLSDAGVLRKVITGKANLSANYRLKFARALNLKTRETQYFDYLVQFNQAKSIEQKNYFFSQISLFRGSKAAVVQAGQGRFYSRWYYPVVRSFLGMEGNQSNFNVMAERIFPKVTPAQVKEAVKTLMELKLIKKTANGYSLTDKHITTENEVSDMFARQYIQELIILASSVFEQVEAGKRHYYSNVFTISRKGIELLKERLLNFEIEQREFIGRDEKEEEVYTLNIQMFPNTK